MELEKNKEQEKENEQDKEKDKKQDQEKSQYIIYPSLLFKLLVLYICYHQTKLTIYKSVKKLLFII